MTPTRPTRVSSNFSFGQPPKARALPQNFCLVCPGCGLAQPCQAGRIQKLVGESLIKRWSGQEALSFWHKCSRARCSEQRRGWSRNNRSNRNNMSNVIILIEFNRGQQISAESWFCCYCFGHFCRWQQFTFWLQMWGGRSRCIPRTYWGNAA